jgi:hypothetical protein
VTDPSWLRPDPAGRLPAGATPVLDVWRVDLGLSPWMQAAADDPAARRLLLDELARVHGGGLRLPLLDQAQHCVQAWQAGTTLTGDSPWSPILRAWGCQSSR